MKSCRMCLSQVIHHEIPGVNFSGDPMKSNNDVYFDR